jgi:hypothetical protein
VEVGTITFAELPVALRHNVVRVGNEDERARSPVTTAATWQPRHRVSFVLPAFNEDANIARAIDSTVAAAERYCEAYEVLVVDDGSTDRTAGVVAQAMRSNPSIRLMHHSTNKGYGQALRTGFEHARLDFVFFTDADNQFDMDELPLLLAWANTADCVAGYRKRRQDPLIRRANAWVWNRLVRILFFVPIRDIDCAFKLIRRSALTRMTIESGGAMINTEIITKLSRAGRTIVEVGVTHHPRLAGSPHGASVGVILRAFVEVTFMYPRLAHLAPVDGGEEQLLAVTELELGSSA